MATTMAQNLSAADARCGANSPAVYALLTAILAVACSASLATAQDSVDLGYAAEITKQREPKVVLERAHRQQAGE
jgi:poly-gamma-glutamate capsule biosynthesis protein CapA/YwtB (metallophosphatase superfamily)